MFGIRVTDKCVSTHEPKAWQPET